MKQLNKISGYYEGPDGIFYDDKHDEIFELEWEGCEIYRRDVGVVGKFYVYRTCQSKAKKNMAICGINNLNVIRLGEL